MRHYEREKEFWPIINRGLLRLLSLVLLIGIVGGRRVTRLLRLAQWHSVNDARGGVSGVRIGMRARYVLKSRNKKTINFYFCVGINSNQSSQQHVYSKDNYKDFRFNSKRNSRKTFFRLKYNKRFKLWKTFFEISYIIRITFKFQSWRRLPNFVF